MEHRTIGGFHTWSLSLGRRQKQILAISNRFSLKTCVNVEMNEKVRFSRGTIFWPFSFLRRRTCLVHASKSSFPHSKNSANSVVYSKARQFAGQERLWSWYGLRSVRSAMRKSDLLRLLLLNFLLSSLSLGNVNSIRHYSNSNWHFLVFARNVIHGNIVAPITNRILVPSTIASRFNDLRSSAGQCKISSDGICTRYPRRIWRFV